MRLDARVSLLLIAAGAAAACNATAPLASTPSPTANPPPTVIYVTAPPATPSAVPTPSPTVDPAAAGKSYLAAAGAYNKATAALDKKYPTFPTLAKARAYYAALAKLERAFADAVRLITFPAAMEGDVRSLLAKDAALQAVEIEASGARTRGQLASAQSAMNSAGRAAAGAANLVRQDLGLPSVPR